jgi:Flp pilus assembly protein TadD
MFLKVCDGVAFAHSRGVIHRDLKPANIMVGDFGEVLVMDWGLAKVRGREDIRAADIIETSRLERAETRTIEGSILGTPAYMAPEQAEGKLDKIDERSDIYSLGAILYEILTLERAIQGENKWQVLANVLNGRIVPPEKRAPNRQPPRELSAIAMKCLSKTRARRYRSVLELRKDIGLFLEGRSVSAAPDAFGQAVVKLVKRNKGASLAAAAAAVVLIAVTIGFIIRLEGQRNRALASERRAVLNEQAALAAQQQQRATALKASEGLAQAAIRAADEGRFADADFRANSALQVMPDGPWGHYALGAVASEKKDFAAARKHLDDALKLDPSHQPSKAFLALVLAASGNLAEAEKLAAEADQSKDWRALAAAGDALYAAQRYTRSAKALERAFAMMEKDPTVALPAKTDVKNRAGRSLACAKTEGFYESIRNLPAGDQAARIRAMLKGVYGSDLAFDVTVERGAVTGINFHDGQPGVRWLDPLRSLPLTWLNVSATSVDDLGPLKGMPLTVLGCAHTPVNDLRPLSGMPLARLHISNTRVSDLRPLSGIPLKELQCTFLRVSDLRPLKGMQLTALDCSCCEIADLGPLEGMPLKDLNCAGTFVTDLSPLKGMPLRRLVCWQSMGHRRVRDLGPLTGLPIEELNVQGTYVTDISPLRGMPLKALDCSGSFESGVSDLGPLSGMRLESLKARETSVTDLTPLKGMPLQMLDLAKSKAADLRPLAGMTLKEFWPPAKKQLTPESLKVVEELEKQGCKINWTE